MRIFQRALVFLGATIGLAAGLPQAYSGAEYEVPILLVRHEPNGPPIGLLKQIPISFSERSKDSPLTISVAENLPGGAGDAIRGSVWMAAASVALEEFTSLDGIRIEVDLEGDVDGPSAGGVVALTIMSYLHGLKLPGDFAFTGTILPDGTVGYVGGVAQKVCAAAAAGKKRVLVPAFYRVEPDLSSGEKVDLKELCQKYGVQFVPVSNLREAYASIHGLPAPQQPQGEVQLPLATERMLTKQATEYLAAGDQIRDALPPNELEIIQADPLATFLFESRAKADTLLRSGNFPAAWDNAVLWGEYWNAYKRNVAYFTSRGFDVEGMQQYITKLVDTSTTALTSGWQSRCLTYRDKPSLAQLETAQSDFGSFVGLLDTFDAQASILNGQYAQHLSAEGARSDLGKWWDAVSGKVQNSDMVLLQFRNLLAIKLLCAHMLERVAPMDTVQDFKDLVPARTAEIT